MSWFLAFAGFAVLIVLHEFGHFVVAKWTGMRVERFFLFFPPRIWSVKRGETEYGVGWIPLGGFVKITGMNPDEVEPRGKPEQGETDEAKETPNDLLGRIESAGQQDTDHLPDGTLRPEIRKRAYYSQPVWKRIAVIAAGPVMNVLIAFLIFFALAFGLQEISGPGLAVSGIQEDSPAEGRLADEDRIVSVDGVTASHLDADERAEALREQIKTHTCAGEPTQGCVSETPAQIVVERNGEPVPIEVFPEYDEAAEQNLVGFRFEPTEISPVDQSVPGAAEWSADRIWFISSETLTIFSRIIDPEEREKISGVVGGYETTRQAIEFDTRMAVGLLGVISLSLAIINLFPFLPLDGGHIFWSLLEKLRGRRASFATMERAGAIGFVLILMLAFIGLSNDIGRLTGEGFDIRSGGR